MTRPRILVTGATGKIGLAVTTELLRRGWPVRALARSRDERSERLALMGAEIAVGDLLKPDDIASALQGVQRVWWMTPFDPKALDAALSFADAAVGARIEAVVSLGQWLASPDHPSLLTRHSHAIDQLFADLPGIAHVAVNPGFFADNYLRLISFSAQLGVLPSLTGESRNAPPSNEDIARVGVAALTDPSRYAGQRFRPTGPALLSTRDMAHILTDVLDRRVRKLEMPMWLFLKAARMQRAGVYEMSGLRWYVTDHRQGAFAAGAPNDDVERLTGRPPEDFATIARRYATRPEARRSFGSQARAWADFLRTPFMPGYALDKWDRQAGVTVPAVRRFALEDSNWRASHGAA
jgi:NAD(P)H dehydrogenase (quinone)